MTDPAFREALASAAIAAAKKRHAITGYEWRDGSLRVLSCPIRKPEPEEPEGGLRPSARQTKLQGSLL